MIGDSRETHDASTASRARGDGTSPAQSFQAASQAGVDVDLVKYLRVLLKHRFIIVGIFAAALVIGLAVTMMSTRIYTASTTLQIDRQTARVLDERQDVSPTEVLIQGEEFFQTQYGLLRSRSLAERVMDSLGLASSDAFIRQMGLEPAAAEGTAAEQAAKRRLRVLRLLQRNLTISPVRGSRLVTLSFDSPDPQLSARIVNAFATNFIQANLDRRFNSTSYVREFLEEQIAATKSKLEDAERQLVAYAGDQQIINVVEPEQASQSSDSLVGRSLVALNNDLSAARSRRISAEAKWRQADSSELMTLPEVLQNQAIQSLTQERAKLSAEYQQKLRIYQPDYPEMLQLRSQIAELDSEIAGIANGIKTSIRSDYLIAANAERALQAQVNGLKGEVLNLRDRSIQYNILQRELDTSRSLYDSLLQRYRAVSVTGDVTTNNISIVDEAQPPVVPTKPRLFLNLAIAALLGLGLGVGLALLLEALDESLEKPEDIEQKLGLPVLGVVPLLGKEESPQEALADVRSGFSEAYYSLRTALQFSTANGAPRSLLITSARASEGKSTTAYAVALNLAKIGKRVLLADGDLRNPSMHRMLGLHNARGFSTLLSGAGDLSDLVQPSGLDNLSFLPCGPLPPNPAELWASDRLRDFLREAMSRYDHIVIDGPPVLGFADAPLLAAAVDGTLFVLESRGTRRAQARGAIRRLLIGDALLVGVVLTKFNTRALEYGGYDYAYDYAYGVDPSAGDKGKGKGKKG